METSLKYRGCNSIPSWSPQRKGEILALSLLHVRRTSQKVHGSRHCVQSVRQALTIVPGHGDQGIVLP